MLSRRSFYLVCGMLLLVLPVLPLEAVFGPFPDQQAAIDSGLWLLGSAIALALAALCGLLPEKLWRAAAAPGRMLLAADRRIFVTAALVLLAGELLFVSARVFHHRPMHLDSIVQLFQAKIFSAGMLYAPVPKHPEFFITQHMLFDGARWYSQYPPGHAALLAVGALLGAAWLAPLALSLLQALSIYLLSREVYGETIARGALLLLLVCPFFLFMGSSFMNHVSAGACLAAGLWLYARWERTASIAAAAGCGLLLGMAAVSRPLCALSFGAVLALFALPQLRRAHGIKSALAGALAAAMPIAAFLWYNSSTTGSPFLTGYTKLWGESHGLGFHESPWGTRHTPLRGLGNELFDLRLLQEYLFEWPLPGLWPLALYLLLSAARIPARGAERRAPAQPERAQPERAERWDLLLLCLLFVLPLTYLFYWHRDSYLGPRFLYAGLVCVIPLTARSIQGVHRRLGQSSARLLQKLARTWPALLAVCLLYALLLGIPLRFSQYESSFQSLKRDLPAELRAQGISRGIIFIPVAWGARILSMLRAAGVSASIAEKVYRSRDHCLLHQIAVDARAKGLPPQQVEARLLALPYERIALMKQMNGDPTLRLRPHVPLAPECAEELRYDSAGYGIFLPHLADNDPRLEGPLLFATDLREHNRLLLAEHPDLPAYILRPEGAVPYTVLQQG